MQKGPKIGGNFTKTANLAMAHLVSEKFCIACSSDKIKRSMKTLEKNYFAAKEILSGQYGSGFGFNSSTYMIEASASTWDSYIKVINRPYGPRAHKDQFSKKTKISKQKYGFSGKTGQSDLGGLFWTHRSHMVFDLIDSKLVGKLTQRATTLQFKPRPKSDMKTSKKPQEFIPVC